MGTGMYYVVSVESRYFTGICGVFRSEEEAQKYINEELLWVDDDSDTESVWYEKIPDTGWHFISDEERF